MSEKITMKKDDCVFCKYTPKEVCEALKEFTGGCFVNQRDNSTCKSDDEITFYHRYEGEGICRLIMIAWCKKLEEMREEARKFVGTLTYPNCENCFWSKDASSEDPALPEHNALIGCRRESEIKSLCHTVKFLNKQWDKARNVRGSRLEAERARVNELKVENRRLEKENQRLKPTEDRVERITRKVLDKNVDMDLLRREITYRDDKLREATATIERLKETCVNNKGFIEHLEEQDTVLSEDLAKAENCIERLKAQRAVNKLEGERDDALEVVKKQSREKSEGLKAERDQTLWAGDCARDDAKTMKAERDCARKSGVRLLRQLEKQEDRHGVEITNLAKILEATKKGSREKSAAITALGDRIDDLRVAGEKAIDDYLAASIEVDNLRAELNESNEKPDTRCKPLFAKIRRLRKACKQMNQSVDRKNMRIAQLEMKEKGK